jgi:hypothetical protein
MKSVRCATVLTLLCAVCVVTADDKKMDMGTIMKKMEQHGALVDEHKVLKAFDGNWTYTGKMSMDPNGEPMPISGTAQNKLLFGGRVLSMNCKSEDDGQSFEGFGWWGYDKSKKKHVFAWVDSMSGTVMNGEGTWDKAKNTLTWESDCYCPIREKKMRMREVIEIRPDGTIHSTAYSRDGGKEVKEMEMTYTRAK